MAKQTFSNNTLATSVIASTQTPWIYVETAGSFSIQDVISVDTNAAATFATGAIGTNVITLTAHGYKTGLVGQFTTTSALPTGISTSTNYYVVVIDANTISVATTYAHATAASPTVVTFTATGAVGTGTFTPTALAGATVQAQWSNIGSGDTNPINIGSATSIAASVNFGVTQDRPPYGYVRLNYAITAGSLSTTATTLVTKDT